MTYDDYKLATPPYIEGDEEEAPVEQDERDEDDYNYGYFDDVDYKDVPYGDLADEEDE